MESVKALAQGPVVEQFVYQEKDFPSILGSTVRHKHNKEEKEEGMIICLVALNFS